MDIPTPGRGYWRKKEQGYKVKKKDLPKLSKNGVEQVTIEHKPSTVSKGDDINQWQKDKILTALKSIRSEPSEHPLIESSIKSFNAAKQDERGILLPRAKKALDLSISKISQDRAFSILNILIRSVIVLEGEVKIDPEKKPKLRIFIDGEELGLSVEEKINRHNHVYNDEEKRRSYYWLPKKYDYEPTGKLTVKLHGNLPRWNGPRTSWSDAKVQRVDQIILKIIIGLYQAAAAQKQKCIDDKIKAKEMEIMHRKAEEVRRNLQLEKQRQLHLQWLAKHYDEAQCIRRLIEHAQQNIDAMSAIKIQDMDYAAWLDWAKLFADRIDPFKNEGYWDIDKHTPLYKVNAYTTDAVF